MISSYLSGKDAVRTLSKEVSQLQRPSGRPALHLDQLDLISRPCMSVYSRYCSVREDATGYGRVVSFER